MTKITSSLSISTLLGLCLALALPAHAQDRAPGPFASPPAAVGDPEIVLYRVPGVADNGGPRTPEWPQPSTARISVASRKPYGS
jgi:hypothetical protein